ncbi:MAG: sigma-70 family RNA polymerase sigma factor [Gemmataceae bacterium]
MTDGVERVYERVLVLRCQAGDVAAFAELVERWTPRLRYYLQRMLDGPDADDALQDVWLDVHRGLGRLAEVAAFPAWLFRLARDRVYRQLRRRRRTEPLRDLDPPAAGDGPDFTAEDAARLHVALAGLPPEQREVVVLRYVQGMTYDDIAAVVGVPVGTVRSRLHYAKRALRLVLERGTNDV